MNACACMGPMYGEPLCYCQMISSGRPLNEEARAAEEKRSNEQLANLFAEGNPFHRPMKDTE